MGSVYREIVPSIGKSALGRIDDYGEADAVWERPRNPKGSSMSTGNWRWKQSELTRAVRAVQAAGLPIRNAEVTNDGTIRIFVGEPAKAAGERPATNNPWDEVFTESDDGTH